MNRSQDQSQVQVDSDSESKAKMLLQKKKKLLIKFLDRVKSSIEDQAKLHLTGLHEIEQKKIEKPQVFISYAWEAGGIRLINLQTFLSRLTEHLTRVGLIIWCDMDHMTGNIDGQMRQGIDHSQYMLLVGTRRYAERTQKDSKANVRMELNFGLQKIAEEKTRDNLSFLLPLLLEGEFFLPYRRVSLLADIRQLPAKNNFDKQVVYLVKGGVVPMSLKIGKIFFKFFQNFLTATRRGKGASHPLPHAVWSMGEKKLTPADLEGITLPSFPIGSAPPVDIAQDKETVLFQQIISACGCHLEVPFGELGMGTIIRDARSWRSLNHVGWKSFDHYVHELTQLSPISVLPIHELTQAPSLGILPVLLGLNKNHSSHPQFKYYDSLRKAYKQHLEWFIAKWAELSSVPCTAVMTAKLMEHKENKQPISAPTHILHSQTSLTKSKYIIFFAILMLFMSFVKDHPGLLLLWSGFISILPRKTPSNSRTAEEICEVQLTRQLMLPFSKNTQCLMSAPSTVVQLTLQDQLIAACKQGDEEKVIALILQGAEPNLANAVGEQPLGAAVWSMNPAIVGRLLKTTDDISSLTWKECEEHNLDYYHEVFIVSEFKPQTFKDWRNLLEKIDPSLFVRNYHLKKVNEFRYGSNPYQWKNLKRIIESCLGLKRGIGAGLRCNDFWPANARTEKGYIEFRTQIKQRIEAAWCPSTGKTL